VARTESPTCPIAYPAAIPVKPQASPAPKCTNPENNEYSDGLTECRKPESQKQDDMVIMGYD
jgi:hypothetical protein